MPVCNLTVGLGVEEYAADPVGVAQYRDACATLDVLYQRFAPARDNQVDVLVQLQQGRYLPSRGNQLAGVGGEPGALESLLEQAHQRGV
jgi:hypothetical protein